jgi:hypothetical protein
MPDDDSLSCEQRRAVEYVAGDLFVAACPGAGKTRTVVERFVQRCGELPRTRGVAIISFSRVAAAEARRRCCEIGRQRFLAFPNFVGTLDGFFIRYLYLPIAHLKNAGRLRVLDAWESVDACVQLTGAKRVKGRGVPLDAFPVEGRHARFDARRLRGAQVVWRHQIDANRADWEAEATKRWETLRKAGFRTCEDVRKTLVSVLGTGKLDFLLRAVAARFAELIVDEAQDCDESQLAVLAQLRRLGLRVALVADPDQAIYEFRQATPLALVQAAKGMHPMALTGNRRGSPAICALANSMLPLDRPEMKPVGASKDCSWPVRVIPYLRDQEHGAAADFLALSAALGCRRSLVIAHSRALAQRASGVPIPSATMHTAAALVRAAATLCAPGAGPQDRMAALSEAERLLLRRLGFDVQHSTVEDVGVADGLNGRWIKAAAIAVLRALQSAAHAEGTVTLSTSVSAARAALEKVDPPSGRSWARTPATLLKCSAAQAKQSVSLGHPSPFRECEVNTVHGVKGQGADAVLVVLPGVERTPPLLDAWRSRRTEDEASRVVYVGVTRAERLVGLAVPAPLSDELVGILRERSVNLTVAPVCVSAALGRQPRTHTEP